MYPDNRSVVKLYYHSPSIENEGKIHFNKFELKRNEILTVMWSIFHRYKTKTLIEVDAKIVRSTEDIQKLLKCSTYINDYSCNVSFLMYVIIMINVNLCYIFCICFCICFCFYESNNFQKYIFEFF